MGCGFFTFFEGEKGGGGWVGVGGWGGVGGGGGLVAEQIVSIRVIKRW